MNDILVTIGVNEVTADSLSGLFSGGCYAWSGGTCNKCCQAEKHCNGHCSGGLKCWCEC